MDRSQLSPERRCRECGETEQCSKYPAAVSGRVIGGRGELDFGTAAAHISEHQTGSTVEAEEEVVGKGKGPGTDAEGERPHELSGGMQQRASICRALISNPSLLLMDEPFSSIDALTRLKLILDLQRIWEEKKITIIFVTHNIEEAVTLGDRVLVLSARPGSLVWEEKINLPRPRNRKSIAAKEFQNHCSVIYEKLGL